MSKKAGMEVARSSECFQRQDLAVVPKPDDTKAEEPKARRPSMDPWPYISKLPDGRRIIISRKNPPTEHPCAYTEMPPDDPGPFSQKSKLRVTGPPIPRAAVTGQIPGTCIICSLVDEHSSTRCPYLNLLPKNAAVSSGCDVVCTVCHRLFSGRCCNQDAGRAELRLCNNCMRIGDHWTSQCPQEDRFFSLIRRKVKF
ncbi:putative transcription factor interactor and regulator CCHC(Zn) family [Rosa chinensis]|uniref:Putative transcription factor interactor and regulator CCHC(Zn) family n=1 Tax=Rosa chinensis TaxID=74649 RepID=A0A2P6R7P7_ROSCH|nr:uncharacterized protein LOC112194907 isoform X1 [Rosa chinensis]PRQ42460.1 putative transcription factor interactor and regulator CCHC(Zn) family [Rosa chinensis]